MDRRKFIGLAVPCAALTLLGKSAFAAPTLVDENSELAKTVHYIADINQVDLASIPNYKKGQRCEVCQLYSPIDGQPDQGECGIFTGQTVKAMGWCASYA
ncbi:high-potential iron-sulfur protein [Leeia sp. TBRC 13508]|uniref:High-potential iron-sulfur protein n=1 Tax=Leeia speluncae TaxID=2884804 RepID=A0ABS8D4K8_9NEIS|nr:high-potential iron-sulfur protein [Leeia speluncae]MCB6183151.1 high-potential iron-sulfur protein [Leeia speluncae]